MKAINKKLSIDLISRLGAPSSPIKAMGLTVSQSEGTRKRSLRLAELAAHPSLKFFSSECHSRALNGEALADEF